MVDGWRLGQWFIDSGVGHGSGAFPWLRWTGEVVEHATLTFNYSLSCKSGDILQFWVNSQITEEFECQGVCPSPFQTYTYRFNLDAINKGTTVTWVLLKTTAAAPDHDCDRVLISDINFIGVHEGEAGSIQCMACNSGTYSDQGGAHFCQPCHPGTANPNKNSPSTICYPCTDNTFADGHGQVNCIPCGDSTTASSDGTHCVFNCSNLVIAPESGRSYNLAPLGNWNISYTTSGVNDTLIEFQIIGNVCGWSSSCVNSFGNPLDSYVCLADRLNQQNNALQDFGKVVHMTETTDIVGLNFHYTSFGNCTTNLFLVCDTNTDSQPMWDPNVDINTFESTCDLSIIWHTPYACPLCSDADMGTSEGDCVNGLKNKTYYWANAYCYGGAVLLPTEVLECTEVKVNKNVIAIIAVVGAAVLVAAFSGIAYLYHKNKKLYSEYSKLKVNNVPMEEDNFRITSLDDEEK